MAHKQYVLHLPYYNSRHLLLRFTSLICHFHFCALFLSILSCRLRFSYILSLLSNVVTSLASCLPSNRDTSLFFRTTHTTCQSLAHFCHDKRCRLFLPKSGDYLHDQITSLPSTPHYLYLHQGWAARTAWRAALLGSIQANVSFHEVQRTVATLMTA